MNLSELYVDTAWTLFLDRDGVINKKRENDYVKSWAEFDFIPGALPALAILATIFGRIIVATNQRGIARGLVTLQSLQIIHNKMLQVVSDSGGRIDAVYYCPHDYSDNCDCRKPRIRMAQKAKSDFPEIDFHKSIVIGDSDSDIEFGRNLNCTSLFVGQKIHPSADMAFKSLYAFSEMVCSPGGQEAHAQPLP